MTQQNQDPQTIYRECVARERAVLETWKDLRETVFRLLYLERPIFPPSAFAPPGAEGPLEREVLKKALLSGRCQEVFALLKGTPHIEDRWELLARWLKQEGVLEPSELILPEDAKRLAIRRFHGLSKKDTLYASLVEIWGPYFERLAAEMGEARPLLHQKEKQLKEAGFEEEPITHVAARREIIPAICDWLADREVLTKDADTQTIRNAHTRCFGGTFKHTSFFFKPKPSSAE
jgi:hypothetical protein